jgi:hypothetical protein
VPVEPRVGDHLGQEPPGLVDKAGDQGLFAQEMTGWPAEISKPLIQRHVSPDWLRAGLREASNVTQLYSEMQHAGPMPDVPLIILYSMTTDAFKEAVSIGESGTCSAGNSRATRLPSWTKRPHAAP